MTIWKLDANTSFAVMTYLPPSNIALMRRMNRSFSTQLTDPNRLADVLVCQDFRFGSLKKVADLIKTQKLLIARDTTFSSRDRKRLHPVFQATVERHGYCVSPNLFCPVQFADIFNFMSGERLSFGDPRCREISCPVGQLNNATQIHLDTAYGNHLVGEISEPKQIKIDDQEACCATELFLEPNKETFPLHNLQRRFYLEPLRVTPREIPARRNSPMLPPDALVTALSFLSCSDLARLRRVDSAFNGMTTDPQTLGAIFYERDSRFGSLENVCRILTLQNLEVVEATVSYEGTAGMMPQQEAALRKAGYIIPEKDFRFHRATYTHAVNFMTGDRSSRVIPRMLPVDLTYDTRAIHINIISNYVLAELPRSVPKKDASFLSVDASPGAFNLHPAPNSVRQLYFVDHLPKIEAPKKEEGKKDGPAS